MKTEKYYSYALDSGGRLIHIDEAEKGKEYKCPVCGAAMIVRKGKIRQHHFAHKAGSENCSYETYLHKIAKKRICECFNESSQFNVLFDREFTCNVVECPLGVSQSCKWNTKEDHNLKRYYSICKEEEFIDIFKADLLISSLWRPNPPILIEICVTHKCTEDKLNSGLRIIEIDIESEKDIEQIVSGKSIKPSDKIRFYNFKTDASLLPDKEYQLPKHRFWIDSNEHYNIDNNGVERCLDKNSPDIDNSIFHIESAAQIRPNFAFCKSAEFGFKNCRVCKLFKMTTYSVREKCFLYRYGGNLYMANKCPHFKQIDYTNQECKITKR